MTFGENLKRLRRDKGWTQGDLAERAGIKPSHISTMEKSDAADPKLSTLYKLLQALECSPNTLLLDDDSVSARGLFAATLERAENSLDEESLRILTDVIDHYIIAKGLARMLKNEDGKVLPKILWSTGDVKPVLKRPILKEQE